MTQHLVAYGLVWLLGGLATVLLALLAVLLPLKKWSAQVYTWLKRQMFVIGYLMRDIGVSFFTGAILAFVFGADEPIKSWAMIFVGTICVISGIILTEKGRK